MSKELKGLYTRQKCNKCGSSMEYMPFARGIYCKKHPKVKATKDFYVHYMGQRRSFADFRSAENYLTEIKRRIENGLSLGQAVNPFSELSQIWLLKMKSSGIGKSYFENLTRYVSCFSSKFAKEDVSDIKYSNIDSFFVEIKDQFSAKTIHHMRSCLNSFYKWLLNYEYIDRVPFASLPVVKVKMKYRQILTKEEQIQVLNQLKIITFDINPRIWIGVCFLCVYVSLRPNALRQIRNSDIDLQLGVIKLRKETTKEGEERLIPVAFDDLFLLSQYIIGDGEEYYFRHTIKRSGVSLNDQFGKKYFLKWWHKARLQAGVRYADLYGGTRHTSITSLLHDLSPEQVKNGSMHSTVASFDRYCQAMKNNSNASLVYDKSRQGIFDV